MGPEQVLRLQIWMDLGLMLMNGELDRSQELEFSIVHAV